MRLAKVRLHNLAISRDDSVVLDFINMGIAELYRRFNLRIKSETVQTNDNLALYELRSPDVLMLLSIYDKTGRELTQTDIIDARCYDYKMVNYRTFLLRKPFNGYVYSIYKASSTILKDEDDYIDLPDAMLDALLGYITYVTHYTINKDNMNEAAMFYQQFQQICQMLENQGYKMSLNTERINMLTRGFI